MSRNLLGPNNGQLMPYVSLMSANHGCLQNQIKYQNRPLFNATLQEASSKFPVEVNSYCNIRLLFEKLAGIGPPDGSGNQVFRIELLA